MYLKGIYDLNLLQPLVCERFLTDTRYWEGYLRVVNALPERRVMGLNSPEIKQVAKQLSREGGEVVMLDGTHRICANGTEVIRAFEAVPSKGLCYEEPSFGAILSTSKSTRSMSGWRCLVAMCRCSTIGLCATPTALMQSGWLVLTKRLCGRFWSVGLTLSASLRHASQWLWRCAISSTKSGSTRFLSASTGLISGA